MLNCCVQALALIDLFRWICVFGKLPRNRLLGQVASPFRASSRLRTAWVGSSIFLGGLKVQWHTLSRWFANVEINVRLLVALEVLLSPQHQQKRWKLRKDNLRPVDLRVTSRAKSDHQMQHRIARFPMMNSGIGITAHSTGISIAL